MHERYKPKRLLSYVVASDTGLAPNIAGDFCSLAVCKPRVRKSATIGQDMILGFSIPKHGRNRLIYAMQVGDKIPYEDYFHDPRFQCKKPDQMARGDNFFDVRGGDLQIVFENAAHFGKPMPIRRDLDAPFAVVSDVFWYFGVEAPEVPSELHDHKLVMPGKSRQGHRNVDEPDVVETITDWLDQWETGIHGHPRDPI